MATRYIDFLVTGDPVTARATAEQALIARKFGVSWHDDWTATAERGSKTANLIVGSLAQYFKVGVRLMSAQPGETTLRIERQSSEWMGGAIGAARTNKNLASLRVELEATFAAAGVLRGVSEGQPAPAPPCAWRDAVKHALGTGLVVIGQDPVGLRGSQLTSRTHSKSRYQPGPMHLATSMRRDRTTSALVRCPWP